MGLGSHKILTNSNKQLQKEMIYSQQTVFKAMENKQEETPTIQQAVEKAKVVEAPKQEPQPLTMIPHVENTYTFSFNEINLIKQALAPFEYVLGIINSTKQRTDSQPNNSVPVYESDIVRTKDANGNEVTNLKNPEQFWKRNSKLKGNSMKIENGELKTAN